MCRLKYTIAMLVINFGGYLGAGEGIRTLDFNLGKVALYP